MRSNPFKFAKSFLIYLQDGRLSDKKENGEVESIIESSFSIKELFEELQDKDKIREELSVITSFDTEAAYKRINKSRPINKLRLLFSAVAAAIVLVASISVIYWMTDDESYNSDLIGSGKTLLKTSDGSIVSLDTVSRIRLSNNLIFQEDEQGTLIIRDNNIPQKGSDELMNTIDVPYKGMHKLILPDGTKVTLNSGSTLEFSDDYFVEDRVVTLNGEGFFDVMKSEGKPFIVKTKDISIRVLGTKFNVKSYDADNTYATLLEGEIEVLDQGYELKIQPGKQFVLDKRTKAIDVKEVDIVPVVAWSDNIFLFDRTPLEEIMQRLSRWYDLDIKYLDDDPSIKSTEYSGKMKMYTHPEDVLRKFEKTGDLKFELKRNTIIISRKVQN